jgi:NADPH:quinone reductase
MTHDVKIQHQDMSATVLNGFGGPDVLVPARRPVPVYGPQDVLIKVAYAGVNRPDVLQRQGGYPPPPGASTEIAGLEVAGEIVAVGTEVLRWHIGDKVCALLPGGGYAAYAAVHHSNVLSVPDGMDLLKAAALPETYFTVWSNVFERGALKPGETFLVHGGTSGIGTTAIQLAKAFGATVIATAGSDQKCAACLELGADLAINYATDDFVAGRRLYPAQSRYRSAGWPDCPDCIPARSEGRAGFSQTDDQAPDPYRVDLAPAQCGAESSHCNHT